MRGEPTQKTLKRLKLELQANASSVKTYVGGGDNGHLGLVYLDQDHVSMPNAQPVVVLTRI